MEFSVRPPPYPTHTVPPHTVHSAHTGFSPLHSASEAPQGAPPGSQHGSGWCNVCPECRSIAIRNQQTPTHTRESTRVDPVAVQALQAAQIPDFPSDPKFCQASGGAWSNKAATDCRGVFLQAFGNPEGGTLLK